MGLSCGYAYEREQTLFENLTDIVEIRVWDFYQVDTPFLADFPHILVASLLSLKSSVFAVMIIVDVVLDAVIFDDGVGFWHEEIG